MRAAIAPLAMALAIQPAHSHCYSIWNYKTPQHCGGVYARAAPERLSRLDPRSVPVPPVRDPVVDWPLPDLTDIVWEAPLDTPGQLELIQSMQRLKALRTLEEQ